MNPEENQKLLNDAAIVQMLRADTDALESLVLAIAELSGFREIDGVPIREWLIQQKIASLQRQLISLEDHNPAAAAHLQQYIEDLSKPGA